MRAAEASTRVGERSELDLALVPTKLALPRVPPTYVQRLQVYRLLDGAARKPLTVVSAGPGWGKTLAVADWAFRRRTAGRVAWVSLDAGDNEPRRFWSYLLAALREADAVPPSNPLARMVPGFGSEEEVGRRLLAGLAQLDSDVVVVLDDFHLIREPVILSHLAALLRHPIAHLQLVLLTRFDPTLPLHRLRMNDDIAEIRARDLGFSQPEASVLMEVHAMPVSPAEAQLLVERTEGWPAGLRLAALFLTRQEPPRRVADFGGDEKTVTGYLAEEVLRAQSPQMRRFLLRTSITERLNSGLAELLTGEPRSQHHLETLEGSNAFVVGLGPGRQWFRYHALLREMLRHRLLVEAPDEVPKLHTLAARWFADNGRPLEALEHAADAEDWALLGRIFVTSGWPLLMSVDRLALGRVLDRVPLTRLVDTPELVLCAAARLFLVGLYQDMWPQLRQAADRLDEAEPDLRTSIMIAQLALFMATARANGDIPMLVDSARAALDLASASGGALPGSVAGRAVALTNLGTGFLWAGRLEAAVRHLEEGLVAAESARLEIGTVNNLAHLGLAAAENGGLREASDYATTALNLVDARGWATIPQVATAYLTLAMVNLTRNNLAQAKVLLAQGRAASAPEPAPHLALGLAEVRLMASLERADAARALLVRLAADVADWSLPTYLSRWWAITEAEVELAAGNPEAAAAKIAPSTDTEPPYARERICLAEALLASGNELGAEQVLDALRSADAPVAMSESERAEMWLLSALSADFLREDNRATDGMRCALELAAGAEILRPFLHHDGDRLRRLLSRLREVDPESADLVDDLVAHLSAGRDGLPSDPSSSELTDRELVILRFLPTMMTNAEIAAELYLSVNTVKTHLKRIFRKLGVTTRRQAAHRARELRLLDDPDTHHDGEPSAGAEEAP